MSALATFFAQASSVPGDQIVEVQGPSVDWRGLLPLIVLMVGALLMLTLSSVLRSRTPRSFYAIATVVVASVAAIATIPLWARVQGWEKVLWWDNGAEVMGPFSTVGGMVGIDGFGLFVTVVVCMAVILTALLADDYLRREGLDEGPALYVLMLLSASGGVMMATANDLLVVFLGLETLSIAVYVLAAMHLRRAQSQESGLKYFVLGSFSSAFFLYGVALVYGATGSTNLIAIKDFMAQVVPAENGLLLLGLALMLVGLAFKVSAVPFHAWSPDVYDGAPSPVVAFMASGVKAAAFAGLVRVFVLTFENYGTTWKPIVYALAILSMVLGAALAIVQSNVKRMMAYSSISHAGFILMAVEAGSADGTAAVLFYLATYTFMVAGSFGVITVVGRRGDGRHELADYRGLARTNPLLAAAFTLLLFAQAGVPFTAGFFAKFYAVTAAVDASSIPLALVAMVSAVIAAFLYLRIVVAMFMSGADDGDDGTVPTRAQRLPIPAGAGLAIGLCVVVTVLYGILPDALVQPAREGQPALVQVDDTDQGVVAPTGP
ncbi:NADH-quinone oxidoreductase subunit N [Rhabdothermincola salaria]|uniref:NADH-quinone oxidoreductase subunit N n=1 Tax=Rhabdothermincola salaria TaxID=2903142 RepID=UPI001E4C4C4B|nr:NADH-quinone oxidoreductase subunit N [Rhabdothermincola salaria]MCD9625735.1 NADH-quinone oxidoreductase subunit N [Rhabdothermincola salaria]